MLSLEIVRDGPITSPVVQKPELKLQKRNSGNEVYSFQFCKPGPNFNYIASYGKFRYWAEKLDDFFGINRVHELSIFSFFRQNFKCNSFLIMHTFLIIFWYFIAMCHLNYIIRPQMDKLSSQKRPRKKQFSMIPLVCTTLKVFKNTLAKILLQ